MLQIILALTISAAPQPSPNTGPQHATILAARDLRAVVKSLGGRYKSDEEIVEQETRYLRYLYLPSRAKDLEDDCVVLAVHANLLSDQGSFGALVRVAPNVLRLDVRDFGWDKRFLVWERFRDLDFFLHAKVKFLKSAVIEEVWPGGKSFITGKEYERGVYDKVEKDAGDEIHAPSPFLPPEDIAYLRRYTLTEAPLLNAEWWFVQTARQISIRNVDEKVGYYEWLGLKNRSDFFDLAGINEAQAIKRFREWRAVVEKSGISQQGRQIVRLGGDDFAWGTLDVFKQIGKGQPKRGLKRGDFAHDAEEWYGRLPNGLMLTFLANAKGVSQASAPDQIGPDKSSLNVGNDGRVHVNLSCMRCHGINKEMLQPVNDWVRKTFRAGGPLLLADPNKKVLKKELEPQYLRDLDRLLTKDRLAYKEAITEVTITKANPKGLTPAQITKLYCEYWNRYVEDVVTIEKAARELGVWKWKLQDAIKRHVKIRGQTDLVIAAFIDDPPGTLTRLEWEDQTYQFAQSLVYGLHLPEIEEKAKGKK